MGSLEQTGCILVHSKKVAEVWGGTQLQGIVKSRQGCISAVRTAWSLTVQLTPAPFRQKIWGSQVLAALKKNRNGTFGIAQHNWTIIL